MKTIIWTILVMGLALSAQANNRPVEPQIDSGCVMRSGVLWCNGKMCTRIGSQYFNC